MKERSPIQPAARAQALPENFFAALEEKINFLQSSGKDVIRLDVGSPDMPPPAGIVETLIRSAQEPRNHGYQALRGPLALRQAWASFYAARFQVDLDANTEILPLMGSKEGIFHFISSWVEPGGVVLIPDPGYMTYTRAALFAGAEPYYFPLNARNGFLPDLSAIPVEVLRRTRMLWLNYPNNPTAAVTDLTTFVQAVALAKEYGFWVCHDAAYSMVTFDGYRASSVLEIPGAKDVCVEFNSLSKSHNMAGWRVGVVVGNARAIRPLARVEVNISSGQFRPIMDAVVFALTGDQTWMAERNEIYRNRRDAAILGLAALGIPVDPPSGAIYLWCPIPNEEKSLDFVLRVLEATGVSFTPGIVFGQEGDNYFRISLTVEEKRIREAMQRMRIWRKE
ncbi:MAG: aminotransferase class I/II-fold pyridoxal phosphate-dependent enzyme [Anaerolineaceae bacterium]|nr:aminotransferase class I/II-fold pyridoxal phosphate-dependent enzyme [Anaerolineaceae bacterium]